MKVFVSVWNCAAAVSRYISLPDGSETFEPALNWEQLEEEAIAEVEAQGGAINLSGHYKASSKLAAKAVFEEQ